MQLLKYVGAVVGVCWHGCWGILAQLLEYVSAVVGVC